MQIIKKLSKMIMEEAGDAEKYAQCALNNKEKDKALADTFYTLAGEELKHLDMLHTQVVRLINEVKAKMDTCCCEIKTQMLQDRLADANAAKVALQNEISNFQQSQYLLQQTGRWVGWSTSGTQASPATT